MNARHVWIPVFLLACAIAGCRSEPWVRLRQKVRVEIRAVSEDASDQSSPFLIRDTGERFRLLPGILLSAEAFEAALLVTNPAGPAEVRLRMSPTGREQVRRITAQNIGKRLGFLVDGELIVAPTVREEVGGDSIAIAFAGVPEAKRVFALLTN